MRPSDPNTSPTYAFLERNRGKIRFVEVGILDRWDELFYIFGHPVERFAFNFMYLPTRNYRPPKIKLHVYIKTVEDMLTVSEERGVEMVPVHTDGFYALGGTVPSKSTLAGLHFRFNRINDYIYGLKRFRLLDYSWRIQPVDLLDALATALLLYFVDAGRVEPIDLEGLRIYLPI